MLEETGKNAGPESRRGRGGQHWSAEAGLETLQGLDLRSCCRKFTRGVRSQHLLESRLPQESLVRVCTGEAPLLVSASLQTGFCFGVCKRILKCDSLYSRGERRQKGPQTPLHGRRSQTALRQTPAPAAGRPPAAPDVSR